MAKYTPEELLSYINEEDLREPLTTAMFNNDCGWSCFHTLCNNAEQREDGAYALLELEDGPDWALPRGEASSFPKIILLRNMGLIYRILMCH